MALASPDKAARWAAWVCVARAARTAPAFSVMPAGVVGLAGGQSRPLIAETGDRGVFGLGPTGVRSRGVGSAGVHARSDVDRGGVFEADHEAQVRLVPQRVRTRLAETTAVTPAGIASSALASGVVSLPKSGEVGDLMTLIDDAGHCILWFCVQDASGAGPARWAQVLLGPAFNGQI